MPPGVFMITPKASWAHPSSVTRERFHALPEPMQREGMLMLAEMGLTPDGVRRQLGLDEAGGRRILGSTALWKRDEPDFAVPKEKPQNARATRAGAGEAVE